jgi:prevent-host-death family protein
MLTVNINEAQERFLELMKQAQNGEAFIIADNDEPLVKVVPYEKQYKSGRLGFMRGHGFVARDFHIKSVDQDEIIAMFEGEE